MKVGLACVFNKTRYFALLSRKWLCFILKGQETGTEHVAIATSKCVPPGIFHNFNAWKSGKVCCTGENSVSLSVFCLAPRV